MTTPIPAQLLDLQTRPFAEVWELQKELVAARQREAVVDTLVLVEHPHVLTLGRGTHRENLLVPSDLPVFEIERGGDVTYHGPGQLVGYPLFALQEPERDLHVYLRRIEAALIGVAEEFGVPAGRRPGWTGVWTEGVVPQRKLASIGISVKRGWVTMHGFALNVCTDLTRFTAINPCGLDAAVMGSLSSCLGRAVTVQEVKPVVVRRMEQVFGRRFAASPTPGA